MEKWTPDLRPVMMTDDIGFVGGNPVSVHFIEARDGLILLDTGYPDMLDGVCANLRALGRDLSEVRYILHSHGHIDHYGCTAEIARRTGAKTYIGKEDAPTVRGEADLSWARELGLPNPEPFVPDILFSNGDVLDLGGRKIRCLHVPGHTDGTYAFFLETKVHGEVRIAAMHGGVGLNTLSIEYLTRMNLDSGIRETFRSGLHRAAREHVDVVLGNHPQQANMAAKIASGAAFADSGEWQRLLAICERQLDDMLEKEKLPSN